MQLLHLIKLIKKYRLLFIITCTITVITAVIFTSFQKEEYKVSSVWLLEKMELRKGASSKGGGQTTSVNLTKYVRDNTFLEAEILNSFPVISKLHKLAKIPYSEKKFNSNIAIYGDYKPYIIVRFYSNSVDEINRVLEISKNFFIENLIASRIQYHSKNIGFLDGLGTQAKTDNMKIKQLLKNAEARYNTLDPMSVGISVQNNLKDYENTINDIKQQIGSQEQSYSSYLHKLKAKDINEIITKANLTSNVIIMDSIKSINEETIENITLKSRYTDKHKTVIESNKRLEELNSELLKYYRAALGNYITEKHLKTLTPYTPIQLNMARDAITTHTNIEADKNRLKIYEQAYEIEKEKIQKASETKYELSYLNAVSDFNEEKLKLVLDLLLKETLNVGFAENNYLQMTIKEPFIKQTKPDYLANIFYALGLGFLLSIFTFLAIENLNPFIHNEDFLQLNHCTILGKLSNTKDLIYSFHQDDNSLKEYTDLKLLFNRIKNDSGANIFTIIPSTDDNSNSIALTNLSITLARTGEKVLLIDLDFDSPQIDKLFEITDKSMTINMFFESNEILPEDLLIKSKEFSNLDIVLTNTPKYVQKETIYYSDCLKDLIKDFSKRYDFVFVNISRIEALPYIALIDHICLLIKYNRTTVSKFHSIVSYLKNNNISLKNCIIDTSEDIVK